MENCKLNERQLPDDILLNIFSRLNIKEQAHTSILSSRWTNLWTFDTRCLNINAADFILISETDRQLKTLKFMNKVDQILEKHRGRFIDELKIIYPDMIGRCVIQGKVDSWIDIAKQKQVKDLYLDFNFLECVYKDHVHMFSIGSTTFSSLVKLYLKQAYLSEKIIHGLISNAANLLELSIIHCNSLLRKHVKISGPSLKLKHLELIDNYIYFLKISAPNLVSFRCSAMVWPRRIYFDNVPLLSQLSCPQWLPLHSWKDFFPLFPQLVTLILTHTHITSDDSGIPNDFPMLTNLENLHVRLLSDDDIAGMSSDDDDDSDRMLFDDDSDRLLALLRASPSLSRLSLDLGTSKQKHNNCLEKLPDHYKFLNEIEIDNFREFEYGMQLPICIARSCSSLRKIIIHPQSDKREYYRKANHVASVV